jgi:hypothetical protein
MTTSTQRSEGISHYTQAVFTQKRGMAAPAKRPSRLGSRAPGPRQKAAVRGPPHGTGSLGPCPRTRQIQSANCASLARTMERLEPRWTKTQQWSSATSRRRPMALDSRTSDRPHREWNAAGQVIAPSHCLVRLSQSSLAATPGRANGAGSCRVQDPIWQFPAGCRRASPERFWG